MLTKVQRQKECIRTDDGRIQSSAFCRRRDNILSAFARTILERLSLMSTVTADGKKNKKKRLNFSYDRLKWNIFAWLSWNKGFPAISCQGWFVD